MRLSALALLLASGCGQTLAPGSWGTFRYFGDILGEPPMRLLPPLTDRDGNIYVLYGDPGRADTQVFVGRVDRGWSGGCSAHRGIYGLHGFLGRSTDRVWYWSGDALVEVDGKTGACNQILRDDPVSGTELSFLGLAPYIDETPSRRFTYALVQGGTGEPQFLMVDLDEALPFNTVPFPEEIAGDLSVLGTGAWTAQRSAVFVVDWGRDVAAFFIDRFGQIQATVEVDLSGESAYAIPGFIEFADSGVGAGVMSSGEVFVLTLQGGSAIEAPFTVGGVLRWRGEVYVTGTDGDEPVIARVTPAGELADAVPFTSSIVASNGLDRKITVNDERGDPARSRSWEEPRTAIGEHPLISPWSIDAYTLWSTGWLVAGPNFDSGVEPVTAVAFAPVGLEVP